MKTKIFFFIAVALFYFATNASAQQVVYEVQKIGDDTIMLPQGQSVEKLGTCTDSSGLVKKYGVKTAKHAYFSKSPVLVNYVQFTEYPFFGLIETEVTTNTFLVREGNALVEKIITTERQDKTTLFFTFYLSFFLFVLGFVWMMIFPKTYSKIKKEKTNAFRGSLIILIIEFLLLCVPSLYFLRFGNLLPLCIAISSLMIGIFVRLFINKCKRKKSVE